MRMSMENRKKREEVKINDSAEIIIIPDEDLPIVEDETNDWQDRGWRFVANITGTTIDQALQLTFQKCMNKIVSYETAPNYGFDKHYLMPSKVHK